ncbi:restriction endonuclease [Yinghuangia soli]|uniref:restriction endonuclease n=1 Tax=Yinghuangia soli TaxID=2908204 RepID=UPI001F2C87F1|nr:restriction endonuclease [Yinghuangia soli]
MGEIFRYAAGKDPVPPDVDGFRNFWHATDTPGQKRVLLESGINSIAEVQAATGPRRAAILIRSSPWKAGSEQTPWHDVFSLEVGHVRYFGDHKPGLAVPVGETKGNGALLRAFERHRAPTADVRRYAEPLLVFRAVRRGSSPKGHVEFCGVGLVERAERLIQWAGEDRDTFANYVYDFAMIDLADEDDSLDWRWIEARRTPGLSIDEALKLAPAAWREWVDKGHSALPRVRRRVARSRIVKSKDQKPPVGSEEAKDLLTIYQFFDNRKHDFEAVASAVAGRILGVGASYREGWLTRRSGDGGADFVGRIDVGRGTAGTSLVVLGQAKCVKPDTSISAEQIARIVARLQRGWIGVYVTTGYFSEAAQVEMVEDQYPISLINGRELATELRSMANEDHDGDLLACLEQLKDSQAAIVTERRPDEVLLL